MNKFYTALVGVMFAVVTLHAQYAANISQAIATPDSNFHVYLCFGQSNMEGNAAIQDVDRTGVNSRFKVMTIAADDYQHLGRTVGNWYTAVPPLCRWDTGLTPADYFGRTLIDSLPGTVSIGVIVVAMGGSGIDAFDKEAYASYYTNADAWQRGLMTIYGGNPYAKIIEAAKKAQKTGVIKGILLHQGESNNGQTDWPVKVKKIYDNLLTDLGIEANSIPLLVGEMLGQAEGGICWGMNSVIARLPYYLPNAFVISSKGCPGNGVDGLHFSSEGARELGRYYGQTLYREVKTYNTVKGQTVDHLTVEKNNLMLQTGSIQKIGLVAVFEDGHTQDISNKATYTISNTEAVRVTNGYIETLKEGIATLTASFKGIAGEPKSTTLTVTASTFPLLAECMDLTMFGVNTFNNTTHTLGICQYGQAGWSFVNGVDLSAYKYLVFKFGNYNYPWGTHIRVKDGSTESTEYKWEGSKQLVINLKTMVTDGGLPIAASHITAVRFWSGGGDIVISKVYLTNNDNYTEPTGIEGVSVKQPSGNDLVDVYSLLGFRIRTHVKRSEATQGLSKGIYMVGREKVIVVK